MQRTTRQGIKQKNKKKKKKTKKNKKKKNRTAHCLHDFNLVLDSDK